MTNSSGSAILKAVLALVALLLLGAAGAESLEDESKLPPPPPPEEEQGLPGNWEVSDGWNLGDEVVELFAKEHGLTPEEGLAVLDYQTKIAAGREAVFKEFSDTIAETEFVLGEQKWIVHVTAEKSQDRQSLDRIYPELTGTIEIRSGAAMTLEELVVRQNSEMRELDAVTGREIIDASYGDTQISDCQHLTGAASEGGRLITMKVPGASLVTGVDYNNWVGCSGLSSISTCTTGMSATKGTLQGYVTAAHCGGSSSSHWYSSMMAYNQLYPYASHRWSNGSYGWSNDSEFIKERFGSTALNNRVYRDESAGFLNMTTHITVPPSTNEAVCGKSAVNTFPEGYGIYGRFDDTAGYFCGKVVDSNSTVFLNHNSANFAKMEISSLYIMSGRVVMGGGSGGPVWHGSEFHGIMVHANDIVGYYGSQQRAGYRDVYYQHADAIEQQLGVTLYMGS